RLSAIKANTAVGFALAGLTLWLNVRVEKRRSPRNQLLNQVGAIAMVLLGVLTLYQYLLNRNLGIDEALFRDYAPSATTSHPGRMGFNTAVNFVLTGAALSLLGLENLTKQVKGRWMVITAQGLALTAGLISFQAVLGYLYGVRVFYQFSVYTTSMALPTALTFSVLCFGILVSRHDRGLMRPLTSGLSGGMLARRLLPVAVLLPLLLGGLILHGQRAKLYDPSFGLSLLALSCSLGFVALIWHNARWLNRLDGDRHRFDAQLRRTENRLRLFFESELIGMLYGNGHGGIQDTNDALLNILGYSRADLEAGKIRWDAITPPEYLPIDAERRAEAQARGVCTPYEKEYIRKDGSRVFVLVGYILTGADRQESVAFILDISDRKRLEQTLRQQTQELSRANRLKDEFLAVLSHELRTPLNPILGWTTLLKNRTLPEPQVSHALDTIERNARLQLHLIEDLLDISRIIQGQLKLEFEAVDLAQVLLNAIDTVQLAAQTKAIELQFQPAETLISGDRSRLQQVFCNLLSNAIKFTPNHGRVTIKLERIEAQERLPAAPSIVQITITDTGIGISPVFLPHIFEYFRQADSSSTRQFGGLGLGLAIVKQLVELHGGSIQATSPGEGQGATFTVQLPLMQTAIITQHKPETTPVLHSLMGIQVLVVDDEPDNLNLMVFLLQQQGASVVGVASAQTALEAIAQAKPDVLISDVGMAETNGYEFLRQVRSLSPQQGGLVPAIAVTAFAGEGEKQQALTAGFQSYLTKPIDPNSLTQAVQQLAR
ncbi:MAG TPA: ATP-binding protein, partial [Thermosynechococcaceae cyanobacterium]